MIKYVIIILIINVTEFLLTSIKIVDDSLSINGHNNKFKGYWPNGPAPVNGCSASKVSDQSKGYDQFCIQQGSEDSNATVAHEMGHNILRRLLNHPSGLSNCSTSYLPGVMSGNATVQSGEKCPTSEGWSDFIAVATYFKPSTSIVGVWGSNLEANTFVGNDFTPMRCIDQNGMPHRQVGNVSRFFWDLYDNVVIDDQMTLNSFNYVDNENIPIQTMLDIWNKFPSGTGNHDASESGDNGRNIRDYLYWAENSFGELFYSELYVNCLTDQTSD